jgi:spore coat protein U-like protein
MFKSINRVVRWAAVGSVTVLGAAAQPATAADAAANLEVSATVTANCAVSTSPIAFGNINVTSNSNVDAAGSLSVTCTNGTPWSAAADAGSGSGADLSLRKMTSGSNLLNYVLYTDSNRTSLWGDGVEGTSTVDGTGSGIAQSRSIYGRVPAGQTGVLAGDYADTVTVTVTY